MGMGPSNARENLEEGEQLSAGISSLTSDDRQESSGGSAPETGSSLQSPVPSADSRFSADHLQKPIFSSADSTGGSTQETGSHQQSQPDSSADPQTPREAGPDQVQTDELEGLSGHEIMQLAHDAYKDRQYDHADLLLNSAEATGGVEASELALARGYVARGRARSDLAGPPSDPGTVPRGPSEAVPADGGYLAGA